MTKQNTFFCSGALKSNLNQMNLNPEQEPKNQINLKPGPDKLINKNQKPEPGVNPMNN